MGCFSGDSLGPLTLLCILLSLYLISTAHSLPESTSQPSSENVGRAGKNIPSLALQGSSSEHDVHTPDHALLTSAVTADTSNPEDSWDASNPETAGEELQEGSGAHLLLWTHKQDKLPRGSFAAGGGNVGLGGGYPGAVLESDVASGGNQSLSKPPDKVWPPFEPNLWVILASILSVVGAGLANAAGVGGGGLFVPMFNLLLGYDAKTSTALSKSMVMGGAFASVCFNVQLKHPSRDRALINYNVATLMQPMLLLGISTGVLFNVMFPPWLIIALLFILLLLMTVKTLDKGLATRAKEKAIQAAAAEGRSVSIKRVNVRDSDVGAQGGRQESLTQPLFRTTLSGRVLVEQPYYDYEGPGEAAEDWEDVEDEEGEDDGTEGGRGRAGEGQSGAEVPAVSLSGARSSTGARSEQSVRRQSLGRSQSMMQRLLIGTPREVPFHELVDWRALFSLVLVWGIYLIIQVANSYCEKCSPAYWTLTVFQIPVSLVATLVAARRLNLEHQRRLSGDHPDGAYGAEDEEEAKWEFTKVCIYPLYALLAGVMGGLLGIGGGMVMGPVLLELGLKPQVTAATSTFIVVFSSSLSVVEFYLLGRIPIEVALFFNALAVVAAFAGLSIIRAYVAKSGKASIIIFILGGIIGVSGIILGTLGTLRVYDEWQEGTADFGFRNPCQSIWH